MIKLFRQKVHVLALGLVSFAGYSQQDVQFTQYMHNKIFYNPGVAGNSSVICVTGFHRSQWVGFKGAPSTQNITVNVPIKILKGGFGISITNDQLGFYQNMNAGLGYAYQLRLSNGTLGFGLMAHLFNNALQNAKWSPASGERGFADHNLASPNAGGILFDLSFGTYYESDKIWMSLSSTRLLETTVEVDPYTKTSSATQFANMRNMRHYYIMGGYNWSTLATNWEIHPSTLLKMDFLSSPQIDFNITTVYNNKFWGGVTYRLTDAIGLNIGYQFNEPFKAGYSYDIPISPLANTTGGSHEVFLSYCFKVKIPPREEGSYKNPRFL